MRKVKVWLLGMTVVAFSILAACSGDEVIATAFSAADQFEIDKELINDYLALKQYPEDTTERGVRLVVLEEGTGESVEVSDLVYFDYIGRFLTVNDDDEIIDTVVFDTSIFSVAQEKQGVETNDPGRYREIIYTYSADGWTLTPDAGTGTSFITGFSDGVTEIMKQLRVGGRGEIILPSNVAYGPIGTTGIGGNQVLIFEILLRQFDK